MIRKMTVDDIHRVGQIWVDASIKAHHVVPADFWRSDLKTMTTEILPRAEGYVHESEGVIDGFITLGHCFVGCLFVEPASQRCGIGSGLLDYVKQSNRKLVLHVYHQNPEAVQFYKSQGFRITGESRCQYTRCPECIMEWTS